MSFYIDKKTVKVNLDQDNWVFVPEELSVEEIMEINKKVDLVKLQQGQQTVEDMISIAEVLIQDWNLLDSTLTKVEFDKSKIKRLSPSALSLIMNKILEVLSVNVEVDKKKAV